MEEWNKGHQNGPDSGVLRERLIDLLGVDVIIGELGQEVLEGDPLPLPPTLVALFRLLPAISATTE